MHIIRNDGDCYIYRNMWAPRGKRGGQQNFRVVYSTMTIRLNRLSVSTAGIYITPKQDRQFLIRSSVLYIVMSGTLEKPVSPEYDSNDYDSDDSDDNVELDRQPMQLFGSKCDNWNDVCAALKQRPKLLEDSLFLYRKPPRLLANIQPIPRLSNQRVISSASELY